ncbi:MAG TPA: hypothetical protein VI911_10495 [Patescibacteria group bacterium]|nr:hypothetical protein [Patescibacteria group bacterium]
MSQAITHLTDVYVSKGFDGKPQASFKANDKGEYGQVNFKVSHKKYTKTGEKAQYDNYSIQWRNVKGDSKVIELLNQPGTRVSLYGEQTQEVYMEKSFIRVTCEGRNAVNIVFGDRQTNEAAPAAASQASISNDDL